MECTGEFEKYYNDLVCRCYPTYSCSGDVCCLTCENCRITPCGIIGLFVIPLPFINPICICEKCSVKCPDYPSVNCPTINCCPSYRSDAPPMQAMNFSTEEGAVNYTNP